MSGGTPPLTTATHRPTHAKNGTVRHRIPLCSPSNHHSSKFSTVAATLSFFSFSSCAIIFSIWSGGSPGPVYASNGGGRVPSEVGGYGGPLSDLDGVDAKLAARSTVLHVALVRPKEGEEEVVVKDEEGDADEDDEEKERRIILEAKRKDCPSALRPAVDADE